MTRHINRAGLDIIRTCEGCRLKAYPDPGSGGDPWTIGYGHTGPDVKPGTIITQDEAEGLLIQDVRRFEQGVDRLAPVATDNQFSAMVSFAFNLGLGNLAESTLLRLHRDGKYQAAQAEFHHWVRAGNHIMPGLVRRRGLEAQLYGKGPTQ